MKTVNLAATLLEVLLLAEGAQKRRPSFSESEHGVLSKKILLTILRKKQLCDVLNTMESKGLSSKPLKDDRNNANSGINRETRVKRKEILEKKKAIDEVVKAASSEKDPLSSLSPLCHYHTKGISVYLEPGRGDKLSFPVKHYIQNLLKVNMEGPYGSEWPMEEKIKRREMVVPEARYIFVYEALDACQCESSVMHTEKRTSASYLKHKEPMVGFLHYRFVVEEEVPVLYVYELQLEPRVRGKGLGKFLMQLIECIAQKNHMGAVMLTVQKANLDAMNFYTSKLGYLISTTSPSRVDPLIGLEKSYEILCKTFSNDAKALLEESG